MDWNSFVYEILRNYPWFFPIILIIVIVFLVSVVYKIVTGKASFSIFGFKYENNKTAQELQKQIVDLNKNLHLNNHVIKLLNQATITTTSWVDLSPQKYLNKVDSFYDFFLMGIIDVIKKNDNFHRIAVFCKANDNELKIFHGYGYSPEGKEHLRLDLYRSKGGYCFLNDKTYFCNDISKDPTFERNPKSSRTYYSLICVPIKYGSQVIGVLNIDGLNKDSFDKDDVDYITYFANAISPILYQEIQYKYELSIREELENEKKKSG